MTPDPRIETIRQPLLYIENKEALAALDSLAADLDKRTYERDEAIRVDGKMIAHLQAQLAATREALARALVHVKHMEMPDTGVIGPGGEREKDHHEALLAEEIKTWEAALEGSLLSAAIAGERQHRELVKVCGFCKNGPVGNAATWVDGKPRPPAPCPRCGKTYPRPA